jgi:tripeptide aminopeptidase
MVNEDRLVSRFLEYVQIDSVSLKEGRFAARLCADLAALGASVTVDQANASTGGDTGNVIAHFPGTRPAPSIMFCCHMDTVTPGEGIKPAIRDGVIFSDGTTILGGDDKAGISAVMEALQVMHETNNPHGPIEVAFTISEEIGLLGSKFINRSIIQSKWVFVLDSGSDPGSIIGTAPAQDQINVKITGKAAHAGAAPEKGVSAIMVAADAISRMKLLRVDPETTANVGVISGGSATNIVCPEVTIKAEARSLQNLKLEQQTAHMKQCFEEAAARLGAHADVRVERSYSAYRFNENDEIIQVAKRALIRAGFQPVIVPSGGGSDANIFNASGLTTVNLGIGERQGHTTEEHLAISDLVKSANIILAIIAEASA